MSHFKGPALKAGLPEFSPHTSVLKKIHQTLVRNGHNVAMVEGWSGQQMSFQELLKESMIVAAGLRNLGVTGGDHILFCCEKSLLLFVLLLGTHFVGATAVLFPTPHADIIPDLVHDKIIKVVFSDLEYFETLSRSVAGLKVQPLLMAAIDRTDESLQSLMKPAADFEVFEVKDPRKHVALVTFSSGTTGVPKAIQVTDNCLQFIGLNLKLNNKSLLTASPFYWLSSEVFFMSSFFWNFTVVFNKSFDVNTTLELIQKYQVECWFAGSGAMTKYINEPKLKHFDLTSVNKVIAGGEPVLSWTLKDFSSNVVGGDVPFEMVYGASEVGISTTYCTQKYHDREVPAGIGGEPYPGVEVKVMNEEGVLVPVGSLGEVCVKSPGRSVGYWVKPELNKEAFDEEGFFKTGDAGFCDSQGHLHLRGRITDLVTFRGIRLAPLDLENLLMSHPGVLDVAVVGRPHVTDTQHLTAFVVRVPNSDVTEKELQYFVDSKVKDELRLRGGVHFLQMLPRTIIGKVQRKRLKGMPLGKSYLTNLNIVC